MANSAIQTFPFDNSAARIRYFLGQVLTQRDLQLEQEYHLMLQRLLQREAFGTGTVAGLGVRSSTTVTTGSDSRSVLLEPGLAYDPDGRELILEREISIEVADLAPQGSPNGFGSISSMAQLASAVADRFLGVALDAFNEAELAVLTTDLVTTGLFTTTPPVNTLAAILSLIPVPQSADLPVVRPPQLLREWLFDQLVGTTYIGISYRETATDPAPANLDASCCGERVCFASRTQQGVTVATSREPFSVPTDPFVDFKVRIDAELLSQIQASSTASTQLDCHRALCNALVRGPLQGPAWRGTPAVAASCANPAFPVIPLARVSWRRIAEPDLSPLPPILSIDNCTYRPLAPGLPALRALLASLTSCATPSFMAPRIIAVTPADGAEIPVASTGNVPDRIRLVASSNAKLAMAAGSPIGNAWKIVYYPASGSGSIVTYPTASAPTKGPANTDVTVTFVDSPNGIGTDIVISFSGNGTFPVGTYVWSLPNATASSSVIVASGTTRQLDGDPNPPNAVPSGDGIPGNIQPFEARFHVRA